MDNSRLSKFIYEQKQNDCLLTESINDKGIFKAIMLSGIPGAGKTYTIKQVVSGDIAAKVVNTDTWTEYFMDTFKKEIKDSKLSAHQLFYDKSTKLATSQLTLYLNSMLPLICDWTSTSHNAVIRRYSILKDLGYDIAMVHVNTSIDTAVERMKQRNRKLTREEIEDYYNLMRKIKPYTKSKFDIYIEINNEEGELTDDVIMKAFKRLSVFYSAPVQNKRGVDAIKMMKENGWKYLTPNIYTMEDLKYMTSSWYSVGRDY